LCFIPAFIIIGVRGRKPKEKKGFQRSGVERKIMLKGGFKEEDGRGPDSSGSG